MVPVFQEVASGHKEGLVVLGARGLVDALRTLFQDSEDVVGLPALDELKLVHLSYTPWRVVDLRGEEFS